MLHPVSSTQGSFGVLGVAASGMGTYKLWIDVIAENVANADTIRRSEDPAFAERFLVVEPGAPDGGRGVHVAGVVQGNDEGILQYHPNHPLADDNGMVRVPDISLTDQLTYLIEAQRGYQANISVLDRARTAYETALGIGR